MPFLKLINQKINKDLTTSLFFLFLVFFSNSIYSQVTYSHQDSILGSNTQERAWWDVLHYNLHVQVNPKDSIISGHNTIIYKVVKPYPIMQIDLQEPMEIQRITQGNKEVNYKKIGDVYYLHLAKKQKPGKKNKVTIYFSGHPTIAKNPPWDGGIVWSHDKNGNPWIANANEGIGASVWWPLKDYRGDEPDNGMIISVTCPKGLMDVSNGRLVNVKHYDTTTTWKWKVANPINDYGVNISIGDYVYWKDKYQGLKGPLDMSYYVLKGHKKEAKKQFKQAKKMMKAFEYWFGPYPFYKDGYKLVEVPYLGMEHQSCVTYGNDFQNGYRGTDWSKTGWGMKFDFIIIHESGHEWFANNITAKDIADLWIHESFTCYSEALYLRYYYGKKAASEYIIGLRRLIQNNRPLIGDYGVNDPNITEDIYWKGANILHTLETWVNNDKKWRKILQGLNSTFFHQTVTSKQIEEYITTKSGLNLKPFWNQYLRTTMVPTFHYKVKGNTLYFYYTNIVKNFKMPIEISINNKKMWITPTKDKKSISIDTSINSVDINPNFYIYTKSKK